ncbi:MAG: DNA cytosine methyltransferase [Ktedonobacteraceae bacterium]|nr:DNA cytosine methyltransferase [Ktedonobacteraceae bacterium]
MLTATVQFCGAGGTSEGACLADIHVEAAINHSKTAIATHEANHKGCQYFQQDITEIDPDDVPDSDLLLTSPECTNHSDSKGQKHYHQFDLFGDIVFDPLDEKSRNTMEDVVRFAKAKLSAGKPYKCIVVENVIEVVKWRKYASWFASLVALGYQYQALYWNTQFFGVPQSRDRVYLVFWLRDLPAPDLDFRPTAFCEYCERVIQAVQAWKTLLKWGSYREQYVYRCQCCANEVTPFFIPVASVLNLDSPGDPLFQRTSGRILKKKTIDGIRKGMERFQGQPFLYAYYKKPLYRCLNEPVGTITTMDRWALVIPGRTFEETTYRMLTPHEVKLCMGFSAEYRVLGTKKEQVWQLGNAVCPPIMADILRRCAVAIASSDEQEAA